MGYRWAALASLVLTAGFVIVYVAAVQSQQGDIAWWYVAALAVAALALVVAMTGRRTQAALVVAAVVLAVGVLVGLLSVGLLLIPALIAAIVALVLPVRQPAPAGAVRSSRTGRGTGNRR